MVCASVAVTTTALQPMTMYAATPIQPIQKVSEVGPKSSDAVARYVVDVEKEAKLTQAQKLALLKQKVKYVFILFQENRSFDFHFGTFPGARGLYSQAPEDTPGFYQPFVDTNGNVTTITPFKIPATIKDVNGNTVPMYPADTASVDHSHTGMDRKLDMGADGVARNDQYSLDEEGVTVANGVPSKVPSLEREQFGELVMAHIDCDTVPFLWNYADRFVLYDNFFDTVIGPSTPNAIAMIAGQTGETQWVKHPQLGSNVTTTNESLPVVADPDPYWGSSLDVFSDPQQPEPGRTSNPAPNLTFASLPLSFMGMDIQTTTQSDYNPAFDLVDVQGDIQKIASDSVTPIHWGWYQQGYNHEPTDGSGPATNNDYIAHHNGPQYFGYISNNPEVSSHLHGLGDFYADIQAQKLPAEGGVFYVRGGYNNLDNLNPVDPNPKLATVYNGNDDHPGYSDAQISEALLADEINAIASSPYWKESAIFITYDETDGLYDHTSPVIRSYDPEKNPLSQGPRIPAILISPFAAVHTISHERAEHSSIIKFINELYDLTPLADLPDEAKARKKGQKRFGQADLGPADDKVAGVGDLLSGFDNNRLLGTEPMLPAQYAMIPQAQVTKLPHFGGNGCRVLQIVPTDFGKEGPVPADFNPRPDTNPGIPAAGNWVP
jgi:phospholipase C